MKATLEEFKKTHSQHLPESCEIEVFWTFNFRRSVEEVWSFISDTSRFNRAMGFRPRLESEIDGKLVIQEKILGFPQKWIEHPWIWQANELLAVHREYIHGACDHAYACFRISKTESGSQLQMYYGFATKNLFWKTVFQIGLNKIYKKTRKIFLNFDKSNALADAAYRKAFNCDSATLEKIRVIGKKLILEGCKPECVDRLTDHIAFGDEMQLSRLRIKELANQWRVDWQELMRTAFHACKLDLLTMSWDTMCPHCKGVRKESFALAEVTSSGRCDVCNIDFEVFDEDTLEITFHVHASVREIADQVYCAAEPAKKPHILSQTKVLPNAKSSIRLKLAEGTYRIRLVGADREHLLEVDRSYRTRSLSFDVDSQPTHFSCGPSLEFNFLNSSSRQQMVVVENLVPDRFAIRPRDVFGNSEFRVLFPREYISSGLRLNLGTQVILFTDVVGSTKFYSEVGDARAFLRVKDHFTELEPIVRVTKGVWVKTIGDSVMAAFPSTQQAVKAAQLIQSNFPLDRTDSPIRLRVVIHKGPVIAVNFNTGVDYFGSTVNLAAKLQSVVGAGEIGLSQVCYQETQSQIESLSHRVELCNVGSEKVEVVVLNASQKSKVQIAS